MKKHYEDEVINITKLDKNKLENYEFIDCYFKNCKFNELDINNCSFMDCKFINCDINNINFKNCSAKSLEFIECNIVAIDWNSLLIEDSIYLPIDKFENSFLKFNNFIEMEFIKFNFSNNSIINSTFEDCKLLECDFDSSILDQTTILNSNISKSNFCNATGYIIDIKSNILTGAKFSQPEVYNLLNSLDIEIT